MGVDCWKAFPVEELTARVIFNENKPEKEDFSCFCKDLSHEGSNKHALSWAREWLLLLRNEMSVSYHSGSFQFSTQLFAGASWNKQLQPAPSFSPFHTTCPSLRSDANCLLGSSHAALQCMYMQTCIFIWEEPEPHTPNTHTAFPHSKWPLLWQQQLNTKFREAFSTNYERRDETLGKAMHGLVAHCGSIHRLLWDTLGTLPLVVCHLLGAGNSFL